LSFSKDFSWINLAAITCEWVEDFIFELSQWDGSCRANCVTVSSVEKGVIDKIQAVSTLGGYKAQIVRHKDDKRTDYTRKPMWGATICKKSRICGASSQKNEVDYAGVVYCVTVPTHMLFVRRNNVAIMSGNTEHAVAESYGNENEREYLGNFIGSRTCISATR
jgi:hypothetical protein